MVHAQPEQGFSDSDLAVEALIERRDKITLELEAICLVLSSIDGQLNTIDGQLSAIDELLTAR